MRNNYMAINKSEVSQPLKFVKFGTKRAQSTPLFTQGVGLGWYLVGLAGRLCTKTNRTEKSIIMANYLILNIVIKRW